MESLRDSTGRFAVQERAFKHASRRKPSQVLMQGKKDLSLTASSDGWRAFRSHSFSLLHDVFRHEELLQTLFSSFSVYLPRLDQISSVLLLVQNIEGIPCLVACSETGYEEGRSPVLPRPSAFPILGTVNESVVRHGKPLLAARGKRLSAASDEALEAFWECASSFKDAPNQCIVQIPLYANALFRDQVTAVLTLDMTWHYENLSEAVLSDITRALKHMVDEKLGRASVKTTSPHFVEECSETGVHVSETAPGWYNLAGRTDTISSLVGGKKVEEFGWDRTPVGLSGFTFSPSAHPNRRSERFLAKARISVSSSSSTTGWESIPSEKEFSQLQASQAYELAIDRPISTSPFTLAGNAQTLEDAFSLSLWTPASGEKCLRVAVIDSGVCRLYSCPNVTRYNMTIIGGADSVDELGTDAIGHGTHVTGIIHQLLPKAQILSYQVTDERGAVFLNMVAEAVYQAVKQKCSVINLSIGRSAPVLDEAVMKSFNASLQFAANSGVAVNIAAGNPTQHIRWWDEIYNLASFVVECLDTNLARLDNAPPGTICAPGTNIASSLSFTFQPDKFRCVVLANEKLAIASGSSMSTAVVSARCASDGWVNVKERVEQLDGFKMLHRC